VPQFSIGGSVAGLAASQRVTLQNNGADALVVSANGSFTFATRISGAYAVTVSGQPSGQVCSVSQGTGTATVNVTAVQVTCSAPPVSTFTLGGQVSGLANNASVVLQNNGANDLTITANGSFRFAAPAPAGTAYAVTALTQPAGQTCTISNGAGSLQANVDSVAVACTNNPVSPAPAITFLYEGLPGFLQPGDVIAQANTQGARQFAYFGPIGFGAAGTINFYVKDTSATYQYEQLAVPADATALEAQLNSQGARGFVLKTFLSGISGGGFAAIYVKDSLRAGIFNYRLLPASDRSDVALTQLNAQGADGYYNQGGFFFPVGQVSVNIFKTDNTGARYVYAIDQDPRLGPAFQQQISARGQAGFRFLSGAIFPGVGSPLQNANVYVRDANQNATFAYELLATSSTGAALVSQANTQGARGAMFDGQLVFFPNGLTGVTETRTLYVTPGNCTGSMICRSGRSTFF